MKFFLLCWLTCSCIFAEFIPFTKCFPPGWKRIRLKGSGSYISAYEKNHFDRVTPSEEPRIPKIIHHIWLGSPLPPIFEKYVDSWKKYHPDWEHKLWTDADLDSFPLITSKKIYKAKNHGQRSDIFRVEILYRYGGLYVDTDFLCLKPHDTIHHTCDFYAAMADNIVLTGLIGSAPKHPLLKDYLDAINACNPFDASHKERKASKVVRIMHSTGPYIFTKLVLKHINQDSSGIIIYPNKYYYSFPGKLRHQFWGADENMGVVNPYINPDALAIHLWATSWHNLPSPRNRKKPSPSPKNVN